jgi:lipopolysaccharide/colanic/teichoic acid biosynthesis glycosyltransferase
VSQYFLRECRFVLTVSDGCYGSRRYRGAKRVTDVAVALTALTVLAPLLLVLAALVLLDVGWPVLFKQVRPGLHGRPFVIVKFRTMRAPGEGRELMDDEVRLTRFGSLMRDTSLDELPELLNVLRGQMSLVGPRPLLLEYLPRYSCEQARRNLVLPGITGLAQVSGRNSLPWAEKFQLDVAYVETASWWLDLQILARSVRYVVQRRGIDADGEIGSPEFFGESTAEVAQASSQR